MLTLSEEDEYDLIRIPKSDEPRPLFKSATPYKNFSEIAIQQFLKANVKRAEIKVPRGRDVGGTARGLGKILKRMGLSDKIACRIDTESRLWLFRRE